MTMLISDAGTFGPFNAIDDLGDRLRCDGLDFQFNIIGAYHLDDDAPEPQPPKPTVPTSITMRQARLALFGTGLLDTVNATVAAMPGVDGDKARIYWEYSSAVLREEPLVATLGAAIGLTPAQVDSLFIQGESL